MAFFSRYVWKERSVTQAIPLQQCHQTAEDKGYGNKLFIEYAISFVRVN